LLKPRFETQTLLLWVLPPSVLLIGAIALLMAARQRRVAPAAVTPLSPAEQKRVAALVEQPTDKSR
jgi:cytochrome c-type biogenesis protein CcmH